MVSDGEEIVRNAIISIPVPPGVMITEVMTTRGIVFSADEIILIALGNLVPGGQVDINYMGTGRVKEGTTLTLECRARVTYEGGTTFVPLE